MSGHPTIGVFKTDDTLVIRPAPNGGFIVETDPEDMGVRRELLGAYTSPFDLFSALAGAFDLAVVSRKAQAKEDFHTLSIEALSSVLQKTA